MTQCFRTRPDLCLLATTCQRAVACGVAMVTLSWWACGPVKYWDEASSECCMKSSNNMCIHDVPNKSAPHTLFSFYPQCLHIREALSCTVLDNLFSSLMYYVKIVSCRGLLITIWRLEQDEKYSSLNVWGFYMYPFMIHLSTSC